MLKKLLVHEWKDTWKLVGILNLVVIALTIIGSIFSAHARLNEEYYTDNPYIILALVLYVCTYVITVSSLCMVVSIYFYIRFYKNLYTDQGYLMHTLPVSSHELIWSKTIVACTWMLISSVVMIGSVLTLIASALSPDELVDMRENFSEFLSSLDGTVNMVIVIVLYILAILVAQLMSVFMGYASISIGQTFKKQKALGAVGIYIGIYMLLNIVFSYSSMVVSLNMEKYYLAMNTMSEGTVIMIVLMVTNIVLIALAAAFYYLTNRLMNKSLNLE